MAMGGAERLSHDGEHHHTHPHLAGGLQVHAQEQSPPWLVPACVRVCARAALLAEFFASHLPPGLPLLVSSLKVALLKADVPLLSSPTASAQSAAR